MWGTVLALALVATVDPLRIGFAALVISRPRPMRNLFAFWLGGITMCIATGLTVLFVLRDFALRIMHGVVSFAATPTGVKLQLVVGVLALLLAAVMTASLLKRRRTAVPTSAHAGAAGLPPDPLLARLPKPVQNLIEGGALWVSFVAGIMMATPIEYAVALGVILAAGPGVGTQILAVVVFSCVAFVIAEIPLLGHLVAPTKTEGIVAPVHMWVRSRRVHVITLIVAIVGVLLLLNVAGSG